MKSAAVVFCWSSTLSFLAVCSRMEMDSCLTFAVTFKTLLADLNLNLPYLVNQKDTGEKM